MALNGICTTQSVTSFDAHWLQDEIYTNSLTLESRVLPHTSGRQGWLMFDPLCDDLGYSTSQRATGFICLDLPCVQPG